jgi:hypothetical protein
MRACDSASLGNFFGTEARLQTDNYRLIPVQSDERAFCHVK